jgi:hypothetical protein
MGGKGPRTRSLEKFRTRQTSCRLSDANRDDRQDFPVASSKRKAGDSKASPVGGYARHARSPRKLLAPTPPSSQAPKPMNSSGHSQTGPRVLVAAVLFAAFSWTLLVSVSPQLHARIHADANQADHVCAITLIGSGSYEHGAQPPLATVPLPAVQFSKIPALTPCWVQSPFLGAHIFEHAPPARG